MCRLGLCPQCEFPWTLSMSLIADGVPPGTASRLDSRWCANLMTAAITATVGLLGSYQTALLPWTFCEPQVCGI